MNTIAFLASLVASVSLLGAAGLTLDAGGTESIDRIIGDGEFNRVYAISLAPQHLQKQQITDRLEKMVSLLGSRDVGEMPAALQQERARNLRHLLEYRERGEFPVNYDFPGKHLPCFIDSTGAICAVGYLVEKSVGREIAEAINREYKYATVNQMRSPILDNWIARSGFSHAEIATIQEPAMQQVLTIDEKGDTTESWETGSRMALPKASSTPIIRMKPRGNDSAARPAPKPARKPTPTISQKRRSR